MEGLLLLRPSMTFLLASSPHPFHRALLRSFREDLAGGSGDNASIPGGSSAPERPSFELHPSQPGLPSPRRPLWALGPRAAARAQAHRRAIQARKGRRQQQQQQRQLCQASPRLFFPALDQEGPQGRRGWKKREPLRRKKAGETQESAQEPLPPLVLVGRAAGTTAAAAQSEKSGKRPFFLPQLDAASSPREPPPPPRPPPGPRPSPPLPSLALAGAFPARRPLRNIFPILRNL